MPLPLRPPDPLASVEAEAKALLQKHQQNPKQIVRTDAASILFVTEDDRAMTAWILRNADQSVRGVLVEGGFESFPPDPPTEEDSDVPESA